MKEVLHELRPLRELPCDDEDKIKDIVENAGLDIPTRIALLAGALPKYQKARMGAASMVVISLIFDIDPARLLILETITNEKQRLERLESGVRHFLISQFYLCTQLFYSFSSLWLALI